MIVYMCAMFCYALYGCSADLPNFEAFRAGEYRTVPGDMIFS